MSALLLAIIFLSFVSLGLPDAALGAAWPVMYPDLGAATGAAGSVSLVVTAGTIVSSLLSGPVIRRFSTGLVNLISTLLTGLALLGYAWSPSLPWLLIFAVPLGLGAGSVDAALNNYVALHYQAHHMNWLHSFWGLGAMVSPVILARLIATTASWRTGYRILAAIQLTLGVILLLTLPVWRKVSRQKPAKTISAEQIEVTTSGGGLSLQDEVVPSAWQPEAEARKMRMLLGKKGLVMTLLAFFMYCGAEISIGLWGATCLVQVRGLPVERASLLVASYFAGIMAGRFLSGFLTFRWSTPLLIRTGILLSLCGVLLIAFAGAPLMLQAGFILVGLGFAPVFPGMVHETPLRFGDERSQSIIGFQMAAAYVGSLLFPPAIGWASGRYSLRILLPVVTLAIVALLICTESVTWLQITGSRQSHMDNH